MTREQLLVTYDREYAAKYDATFIASNDAGIAAKTECELALLRNLTEVASSWLDIGCGTGFFLQHGRSRPTLHCAGVDLSPAMLAHAKQRNPDAVLVEGDFCDASLFSPGSFDLVSCMWGAIGLVRSVEEVHVVIGNMAAWTTDNGSAFICAFDPDQLARRRREGRLPLGLHVSEDGTTWSHVDTDGKRHDDVLSPSVLDLRDAVGRYFESVIAIPYPPVGYGTLLTGLLAHAPKRDSSTLGGRHSG